MAETGDSHDTPSPTTNDMPKKDPIAGLNVDTSTWEGLMNSFFVWAAKEPWTFLYYVLIFLSPFFLISAFLSHKLSKAIDKQEKAKAKAALRRSPRKHNKAD